MAHGPDTTPGAAGDSRRRGLRGRDGFFHLAQGANGAWTLFDPAARPVFLKGVHGVRVEPLPPDGGPAPDPVARLNQWRFNAVGLGGDGSGRDDGLPFLASAELANAVPVITGPGIRVPDVYSPEWPAHAAVAARQACGPLASSAQLIGWVTDETVAFGPAAGDGRPGLLQTCLSAEPSIAAYHGAWEFVAAVHGQGIEALADAWEIALPNKPALRELTHAEKPVSSAAYWRDDAQWSREILQRYLSVAARVIREADPNHLVLGCHLATRIAPLGFAPVAQGIVDVLLLPWTQWLAGVPLTGPALLTDVTWRSESEPAPPRSRLSSFERDLRRGRAALQRAARDAFVVGYFWRQWADDPGEQPPFASGLVHVGGAEAREHTEVLLDFNRRADRLRRAHLTKPSP